MAGSQLCAMRILASERLGRSRGISSKASRHLNTHFKTIVALAAGAILLIGLGQSAQAALLNISGASTLADSFGTNSGPEAVSVSWSVVEDASDIYTYSYIVNNPTGDVILTNLGAPTTTPEVVDALSVAFDTTAAGAYIAASQTGGVFDQNNGPAGLFWDFTAINPGTSSPVLSFQSYLPPTLGNANAQDANPPSPWSSSPYGQQVPVPGNGSFVPEPASVSLVVLALPLLAARRRRHA